MSRATRPQCTIKIGREKLTRLILERAAQVMPEFGIELVDVQIQRVNYVESVQAKVFERMISERKRIAERYRSEGQGKAPRSAAQKERELKAIESEAYRKAAGDHGQGRRARRPPSTPPRTAATPSSTSS